MSIVLKKKNNETNTHTLHTHYGYGYDRSAYSMVESLYKTKKKRTKSNPFSMPAGVGVQNTPHTPHNIDV